MAKVNITQIRSRIGATEAQCRNLDALGLRKMGRTVQHEDSPMIMGMIERVHHLVKVEMGAASKAEKPAAKKAAPAKEAPKAEGAVCEAPEVKAAPKAAAAKKPAAKKADAPAEAKPKAPAKPKAAKKADE